MEMRFQLSRSLSVIAVPEHFPMKHMHPGYSEPRLVQKEGGTQRDYFVDARHSDS